MEIACIIHKGWPSERPKEPEISESSAGDDPLSKAIGPHKSLSHRGLQYPQQRSPDKKRKYLRTQKITNSPEQQKITFKYMKQLLHSYVYICSQEFIKNSILSNLSRANCTKTITKTYGLPTILAITKCAILS